MATGEQLKALIKSYIDGDGARFFALALQVAAHEARRGHGKLAQEIRALIDRARAAASQAEIAKKLVPIVHPRGELAGLFSASYPKLHLSDMVLEEPIQARLTRIVREQRARHKLRGFSLEPRRKLLLVGPPGTGKTMTAGALAGELQLPLFIIRLDSLITKFMGETAAKLRLVFEAMASSRGVYLFDEFDSIGAQRALPNEVGEIRRVLNSFLQCIEHDTSDSLILAATNHPDVLDRALFRRFDDVIEYHPRYTRGDASAPGEARGLCQNRYCMAARGKNCHRTQLCRPHACVRKRRQRDGHERSPCHYHRRPATCSVRTEHAGIWRDIWTARKLRLYG